MLLVVMFRQNMAELSDFLLPGSVSCTFKHYSVTFCSLPVLASDVMSSVAVGEVVLDALVPFGGDFRSKRSCLVGPAHFVKDE